MGRPLHDAEQLPLLHRTLRTIAARPACPSSTRRRQPCTARATASTRTRGTERPLNVYGYSKLMFDRYVRRRLDSGGSQVAGLRLLQRLRSRGVPQGSHGQRRPGAFTTRSGRTARRGCSRAAAATRRANSRGTSCTWMTWSRSTCGSAGTLKCPASSTSAPAGRRRSTSWADAVIGWHGAGRKRYIPFPEDLRRAYQSFTQADIARLRRAGYDRPFADVSAGVKAYLDRLHGSDSKRSGHGR